jgi:hypothetical protein
MVASKVSGELILISDVITGLAATNSAPNTSSLIRTLSTARSGAVTEPI